MLIVLIGKTASGKTTVRDVLVEKLAFNPILTYTTRPMRKNERDGIDYHFITDDEFTKMEQAKEFIETTSYVKNDNIFKYGSTLRDYSTSAQHNIMIVDATGVAPLVKYAKQHDIKTCIIMLDIDKDELVRRAMSRGDELTSIYDRLDQDDIRFKPLIDEFHASNNQSFINAIVTINNSATPQDVANNIWSLAQQFDKDNNLVIDNDISI